MQCRCCRAGRAVHVEECHRHLRGDSLTTRSLPATRARARGGEFFERHSGCCPYFCHVSCVPVQRAVCRWQLTQRTPSHTHAPAHTHTLSVRPSTRYVDTNYKHGRGPRLMWPHAEPGAEVTASFVWERRCSLARFTQVNLQGRRTTHAGQTDRHGGRCCVARHTETASPGLAVRMGMMDFRCCPPEYMDEVRTVGSVLPLQVRVQE